MERNLRLETHNLRYGCLPDTGLDTTALDGDIRTLSTQELPHISSHLLCALLPGCLQATIYGSINC